MRSLLCVALMVAVVYAADHLPIQPEHHLPTSISMSRSLHSHSAHGGAAGPHSHHPHHHGSHSHHHGSHLHHHGSHSHHHGSTASLAGISAASPSLSAAVAGSAGFAGSVGSAFTSSVSAHSDAHLPDMHCLWDGQPLRCKGIKKGVCCTKVKFCCKQGYRCDPNGSAHCVRSPTIIIKPVIVVNSPNAAAQGAAHAHNAAHPYLPEAAVDSDDDGTSGDKGVVVVLKNSNTIHKGDCKGKKKHSASCKDHSTTTTTH